MKQILAEILTIGDEILYGQITNTNAQWMGVELGKIGVRVIRHTSIGDKEEEILTALSEAEKRVDIVLITGGLGPTKDDITKKTLAKYFESELVTDEKVLQMITAFFEKRGRTVNDLNRAQALVPDKCEVIYNKLGTAPGMWFERDRKVFMSMPGVPFEMKMLMSDSVLPKIQQFFKTPFIYHKVIQTIDIGESILAEKIAAWEDALPAHIKLAYLPSFSQVRLRLTGISEEQESLIREVEEETAKMLPLIEKYVFAIGEVTIEEAIGNLLLEQNKTLAAAESCTGGFLAHQLTKVPGSSRYFMGGVVAYSNEVKMKQLGVDEETLKNHGAVSEETIREMAENVRLKLNTDIGVATSGVAGPDGGSPEKPVGTVWIAYADEKGTVTKKLQLVSDRLLNIQLTAVFVFDLIRKSLKGIGD